MALLRLGRALVYTRGNFCRRCTPTFTSSPKLLHFTPFSSTVLVGLQEAGHLTEKINRAALRRAAGITAISAEERERICSVWHDAVRLLEPAEVIIPFAERIEVPSAPIRLRRDVPRLLNIIKLIAWVHQHTRDRDEAGRILATEEDFTMAITMVGDSFARAWKSLTPSEETVYAACKDLTDNLRKHGFKRSHVESILKKNREKVPPRTLQNCLHTLASSGYLESDGRRGAAGATYTMTGVEEIGGTITLSAHLRIEENQQESPAKEPNLMRKSQSAHSCALPVSEQLEFSEADKRVIRKNTQNDSCALKNGDLQDNQPNAQMRNGDNPKKGETKLGSYEYLD